MQTLDLTTVLEIQKISTASSLAIGISVFLAKWLIFALGAIVAWYLVSRDRVKREIAIQAALATGFALIIVSVISHFVGRLRPFLASSAVHLLVSPPLKSSFPSGHTSAAFAMAFVLMMIGPRVGVVAFVCASLIALGRMAVGVHYPTDIVAGVLVGLLSAVVVRAAYRDLRKKSS